MHALRTYFCYSFREKTLGFVPRVHFEQKMWPKTRVRSERFRQRKT